MLSRTLARSFSTVSKNAKMKLTLRTPYTTILEDFDEFSNVKGWGDKGTFNIQNRTPPLLYVIPPGPLTVNLSQDVEGFSGQLLHNGAFVVVHPDNSCEINMVDAFNKEDLKGDQLGLWDFPEEDDAQQAMFIKRIRSKTKRSFVKRVL